MTKMIGISVMIVSYSSLYSHVDRIWRLRAVVHQNRFPEILSTPFCLQGHGKLIDSPQASNNQSSFHRNENFLITIPLVSKSFVLCETKTLRLRQFLVEDEIDKIKLTCSLNYFQLQIPRNYASCEANPGTG